MAVTIGEKPSEMAFKPTLSFEEFYRTEWRWVLGLVYALSGSRWAAEDIAQEAFLGLIEAGVGSADSTTRERGYERWR